ncbi:MAG: hypothetical protein AMXMBFR44_3880 [Candidatus Campbellbacteria bacterium]
MTSHHKKPGVDDIDIVPENEGHSSFKPKKSDDIKSELAACRKQSSEYLEGWQRAKADLINFKREAEEKRKQHSKYAAEDLIAQCIPVLDSFDMAFRDKAAWEQAPENWRRGVEFIHTQFLSVLRDNGVVPLSPAGEKFDPAQHDSAGTVSVDSPDADGIIHDVVQRGYKLHEKLIRAPKVIVGHYQS